VRLSRCLTLTCLCYLTSLCAQSSWSQSGPPNGISVGKPKIFDNRTLTLMIESLSQTLQGMQFADQNTLASALLNTQGFRSTDTTSNFAINTTPTPGATHQVVKNTGVVDASGNPLPDSSQTRKTLPKAPWAFFPATAARMTTEKGTAKRCGGPCPPGGNHGTLVEES
jgi:hypothetical protein